MAKTSVKARQRKRERMVEKDAAKRAELKKAGGSIAEMERTKPDLLRDILSVSPYTGSDQVS